MCVYMCVCMYVCIRLYVCMYLYMYMYVCIYVYMYICIYVCMYACTYVCTTTVLYQCTPYHQFNTISLYHHITITHINRNKGVQGVQTAADRCGSHERAGAYSMTYHITIILHILLSYRNNTIILLTSVSKPPNVY
jgi:hypothetical protein